MAQTGPVMAGPGSIVFTEVDGRPLTAVTSESYTAVWADYDGDGRPDVYVPTRVNALPAFFRNTAEGFVAITDGAIGTDIASRTGALWVDIDNDDDQDLFVISRAEPVDFLYRNEGDGTFTSITNDAAVMTVGLGQSGAAADVDNDGWIDLFVPKGGGFEPTADVLLRNRGNGSFEPVQGPFTEVDYSSGASFADYDNDGLMDLLVVHVWFQPNSLFHNNGDGTFTKVLDGAVGGESELTGGNSSAWGDYDNDGDLDLVVTHGSPLNLLYRNEGNGHFTRVRDNPIATEGGDTVGAVWVDFDNDGWLDLLLANRSGENRLYRGIGNGDFEAIKEGPLYTRAWGANGIGAADYDGDGDVDILLDNWLGSGTPTLYRNDSPPGNWLRVRARGTASNRNGVGAKVRVLTQVNGQPHWQMRQVGGEDCFGSQEVLAHFGLGPATRVETLQIEWPSGIRQELTDVAGQQVLVVEEPEPEFRPLRPAALDAQTGLYVQRLRFTPRADQPAGPVRILIRDLPAGVRVTNASGLTNGIPFVALTSAPAAGSFVDLTLTFHDPQRRGVPPLNYVSEFGPWEPPAPPTGDRFEIDRMQRLPGDAGVLVEFSAETGAAYAIEYSPDLATWKVAQGRIVAGGNRVQWVDLGLPATDSLPSANAQRFYRVVKLSGP